MGLWTATVSMHVGAEARPPIRRVNNAPPGSPNRGALQFRLHSFLRADAPTDSWQLRAQEASHRRHELSACRSRPCPGGSRTSRTSADSTAPALDPPRHIRRDRRDVLRALSAHRRCRRDRAGGAAGAEREGPLPDSGLIACKITSLRHGLCASPIFLKQAGASRAPPPRPPCLAFSCRGRTLGINGSRFLMSAARELRRKPGTDGQWRPPRESGIEAGQPAAPQSARPLSCRPSSGQSRLEVWKHAW